jgi:hypothetical protein
VLPKRLPPAAGGSVGGSMSMKAFRLQLSVNKRPGVLRRSPSDFRGIVAGTTALLAEDFQKPSPEFFV